MGFTVLGNLLVRKRKVHQYRLIVTKLYSFLCGCQRVTQIIMERQQMHQLGVSLALGRSLVDVVLKILSGNKPLAIQDWTGMERDFECPPVVMEQWRLPDPQSLWMHRLIPDTHHSVVSFNFLPFLSQGLSRGRSKKASDHFLAATVKH